MWLSKCITDTGPHLWYVERRADSVVAWSPPRVKIRGVLEILEFEASRPDITCRTVRSSRHHSSPANDPPSELYPTA
jgi:hypothetical protein